MISLQNYWPKRNANEKTQTLDVPWRAEFYTCLVEKAMAPHSSNLAWKIPWTEEPGRLQSMGSLRIRHDWATSLSLFTFMHWRRKWQPIQCSCLENPRDQGGWWAAIYGVAQSRTWLKRLSSSSSLQRGFPRWRWLKGKESACDVGATGSIPGSGRSPGVEHSDPLQYSCLENPTDRGAWQATVHRVTESQTQLKQL